jgi:Flp pilus assembly protein TadG
MQSHGQKILSLTSAIVAKARNFCRQKRGNITVIFAVALLPILLAAGGAVDIGVAASQRDSLQDAADSAALAATSAANNYIVQNGSGATQVAAAQALAQTTAQSFITANRNGTTSTPVVSATTSVASNVATVQVSVTSKITTYFLSLIGMNSLPISVLSKTTMTQGNQKYYQIIFVVDTSGSMGIGGTASDISALEANSQITTGDGGSCAFACHDPNSYYAAGSPCLKASSTTTSTVWNGHSFQTTTTTVPGYNYCDTRAIAKAAGITLKIDFVNQAVQTFVSQLAAVNTASTQTGHFYVGIDTFGTAFHTLLAPTTDMVQAASSAAAIDIDPISTQANNWGYTQTKVGLTTALSSLTNIGDGSTASKRVTYIIFLSDAVEDLPAPGANYGRSTDLNYTTACTALKNAGVDMFTIWAPYYAITGDAQYNTLVAPLSSKLGSTMESCASNNGQYFEATDGPDIKAAVNSTFTKIIANSALRISQ